MRTNNSLGIIFRSPAGKVKKRLAFEIGPERALAVYREMLLKTIKKVLSLNDLDIYGFYDGEFPEALALRYKKLVLINQQGKDLGEKMYNAVTYLYENHYNKIVLIGADSPDLPVEYISEAFSRLDSSDVVIGPSEDGGYYLIGMKRPEDYLFKDIPWGSPRVLEGTINILKKQKIPYSLLPEWYDIDNLETLNRYNKAISAADIDL